MQSCSSQGLTTRGRVAAWAARYCAQFDHAEITPGNLDQFDADIHPGQLGGLRFARLTFAGTTLGRRHEVGAVTSPSYTLIVQLAGSGTLSQYGQAAQLQAGDLALCDNAAPHHHQMAAQSELILLRIPAATLRDHLPSPEQLCGRRLPCSAGTTAIAASLVASVCRRPRTDLPAAVHDRLARQILEMIGTSYTLAFDSLVAPASIAGGRYARARRFIEQHLRDPELGPQQIARALNVSSRYLRMIFAGEQESASAYILRRRLEEISLQLVDPRWRGRSICEIAFSWGFNSVPHFSRSFRDRFGMSPRQYRAQQGDPGADLQPAPVAAAS